MRRLIAINAAPVSRNNPKVANAPKMNQNAKRGSVAVMNTKAANVAMPRPNHAKKKFGGRPASGCAAARNRSRGETCRARPMGQSAAVMAMTNPNAAAAIMALGYSASSGLTGSASANVPSSTAGKAMPPLMPTVMCSSMRKLQRPAITKTRKLSLHHQSQIPLG